MITVSTKDKALSSLLKEARNYWSEEVIEEIWPSFEIAANAWFEVQEFALAQNEEPTNLVLTLQKYSKPRGKSRWKPSS